MVSAIVAVALTEYFISEVLATSMLSVLTIPDTTLGVYIKPFCGFITPVNMAEDPLNDAICVWLLVPETVVKN